MNTVILPSQRSGPPTCEDASSSGRSILLASGVITAVFVLSNSATPLYMLWQHRFGFSSGTLTAIFAAYIVGLLVTLPVAGQLSDRLGRRPVLLPGLVSALVACALFATAGSISALLAGRFLTGAAVGVIVSAGMTAVVDVGGHTRKRQASLAASVAMVIGAGLGPLGAGMVAQWAHSPIPIIFAIEAALVVLAAVVVATLPLRRHPRPCAATGMDRFALRLPTIPTANRAHLIQGAAVFAPGLTATSFVLALGPSLLSRLLGVTSPLVAGLTACAMFLTATGVQFAGRGVSVRAMFFLSCTATAGAMVGLLGAIYFSNPVLLVAAAILAGAGQGLGQLGGLTLISLHVPETRRAEAISLLNMGAYVSAGVLPMLSGLAIDTFGLRGGATTFAGVLLCSVAFSALHVARQKA
ncbi:MFS transporter [Variovorax sp. J22P240]|uniref:MFS transporter n=1 Tax=Variovorax sp. J22P240 TaxID=3053514 RepID=UPI0025753BEC|nr:MFS transporter [Variovorax sp. J22P240]MDM0002588.1 MFS transporter [Variovorax sp. J22P240]